MSSASRAIASIRTTDGIRASAADEKTDAVLKLARSIMSSAANLPTRSLSLGDGGARK
jgi:hypothetical protein